MSNTPQFELNNGLKIPAVGIGCWMGSVGETDEVTIMVETALRLGYRHIDTAAAYGNENRVGEGLRKSLIPRQEIFLTTKLANTDHDKPAEALDRSLERLGVEYVDLFLMHWPQAATTDGKVLKPEESPTFVETWKEMEKLVETGKTKSIGVSNFSIQNLEVLLPNAKIIPAVNQVELHPFLPQHELLEFCKSRGILLTAYTPVGKGNIATEPEVIAIANRLGAAPNQVVLSWGVQRNTVVIPKSANEERIKQNLKVVSLADKDMEVLDNLHKKPGLHRSMCAFHSPSLGGSAFGWTYEMLGWNMVEGGVVPTK